MMIELSRFSYLAGNPLPISGLVSTQRIAHVVHPEIKKLFSKCFNDGHTLPTSRPTAKDWCKALQLAIVDLTVCSQVANHSYSKTYGKCYWCKRANILGADIFPPVYNASTPPQPQPQTAKQSQTQSPTKKEKSRIQRWVFSLATIVSIVLGANSGLARLKPY